jgi:low affinity Fe/Cu permease
MDIQVKTCPSSIADMEGQLEELIKFLEYEESITVDSTTQERIRTKLIELGVWQQA